MTTHKHPQPRGFDIIALDADDTLWQNEIFYRQAEEKLARLLSAPQGPEWVVQKLLEVEIANLQAYGYGIKSFVLSMIETAVQITGGRIQATDIQKIIGFGQEMIAAEIQLLDHVLETVAALSASHTLMIITKGDLLDQQRKVARSGLAGYFEHIEIVSEKTSDTYRALLEKYGISPQRFLMAGNSLKSDVLPVAAIGGTAVQIPHASTWAHETVSPHEESQTEYFVLEHLGQLPGLVERLAG
ncbi:MAG: HAD family hydrolase [Gammaproteobacteria bacterium]|nr:HAD family hydrolase [Gammaproteobacteria bacterium]